MSSDMSLCRFVVARMARDNTVHPKLYDTLAAPTCVAVSRPDMYTLRPVTLPRPSHGPRIRRLIAPVGVPACGASNHTPAPVTYRVGPTFSRHVGVP